MARRPVRARPTGMTPLAPAPAPLIVGDRPPATPADQPTAGVPESRTAGVTESQSSGVRAAPGEAEQPRYLRLVRKEARLRHDQVEALAALRRQLGRARVDRSEPLTDNTLIRVAVDLLLSRADALHGDTEDQLRESATAGLPESQSL